jgi:hypothetical protein
LVVTTAEVVTMVKMEVVAMAPTIAKLSWRRILGTWRGTLPKIAATLRCEGEECFEMY